MAVPVMHVRVVDVGMRQRLVLMLVGMRLLAVQVRSVPMLVMFIVVVAMGVHQALMSMFVRMALREM